jgi:hypothetical protein
MDHLKSDAWFWKREMRGRRMALDRAARGGSFDLNRWK